MNTSALRALGVLSSLALVALSVTACEEDAQGSDDCPDDGFCDPTCPGTDPDCESLCPQDDHCDERCGSQDPDCDNPCLEEDLYPNYSCSPDCPNDLDCSDECSERYGDGTCDWDCLLYDPDCSAGCESDGTCIAECGGRDPDCPDPCDPAGHYDDDECQWNCARPDEACHDFDPCLRRGVYDNGTCDLECAWPDPDCDDDSCPTDGRCEADCQGTDPDCARCGEDGECIRDCDDPDCQDCPTDGTCDLDCPGTDPDCRCTPDHTCDEGCDPPDPDCTDPCRFGRYDDGYCDWDCLFDDPDCEGVDRCEDLGLYSDGACDEDCPEPDPDCVTCSADGVCDEGCQPGTDPDCEDCIADDVCDIYCPRGADPDCDLCVADGVCDPECPPDEDPDCAEPSPIAISALTAEPDTLRRAEDCLLTVTATSTVAGPLHYRWTDLGDLVTFAEPGADQPSVTVRAPEEYSQATTSIEVEVWQQDQTSARASVTLSFLDEALLATPDSLVLAEVHATWFRVSWDPVDGAASYYATWSDRQGADDWDTSALAEIVVSGLTEQTTYDFQVQARGERDGGGSIWSDFSAPLAITTPPLQLPPPSVNDPVQNPDGSVTLTWDALDGAIEYRVQRALVDQADQFAALASSTEATITDADVAAGTTYFYRVAGVNADLHVGLWSTSVSILVTE